LARIAGKLKGLGTYSSTYSSTADTNPAGPSALYALYSPCSCRRLTPSVSAALSCVSRCSCTRRISSARFSSRTLIVTYFAVMSSAYHRCAIRHFYFAEIRHLHFVPACHLHITHQFSGNILYSRITFDLMRAINLRTPGTKIAPPKSSVEASAALSKTGWIAKMSLKSRHVSLST